MRHATATRLARFVTSLALLAGCVVAVPWALVRVARARFGGAAPLHGVPAPIDWEWDRIRRALTDQLTDDTIADVVIRTSLLVAWVAIAVLVITVVAESAHMVRHGGLALPDIRGLGPTQGLARMIATGLLVIVPVLTSPSRAVAGTGFTLEAHPPASAAVTDDAPGPAPYHQHDAWTVGGGPTGSTASDEVAAPSTGAARSEYVVRSGDSIYAIAERLVGPDAAQVSAYAERLVDLNLGRRMPDGQHFSNAAYIDVGWVLELPPVPSARPGNGAGRADDRVGEHVGEHVVERGESLWSIAEDELGDPERWPEIHAMNRGRAFGDGRTLDDPSLIQPGWILDLPGDSTGGNDETDVESPTVDDPPPPPASPTGPSDETAGDETAGDETAGDETAGDETAGDETGRDVAGAPSSPGSDLGRPARPSNRWIGAPGALGAAVSPDAATPTAVASDVDGEPRTDASDEAGVQLLTFRRAAMLAAGVLTLLAVRRRSRLRGARPRSRPLEPPPEAAVVERTLRAADHGDRFVRVDIAVRSTVPALVAAGERVVAVAAGDDGAVLLHTSGPVVLDPPWEPIDEPTRWHLPPTVPIEALADAARRVGAPCPTLVQLGRTPDDQDLYVDLEALAALEIGGPGDQADAIVTALATTLAGSVLAEVTTLVGVGVDDDAFLDHRHHLMARDVPHAFALAAEAVGTTATDGRTTFELRARGTGGETWEPAVVLVGAAAGTVSPPSDRTALAVVSASPILGPSSRLEPDVDAWVLRPLGIRCRPVGVTSDDLASLVALVRSADAELVDDHADEGPTPEPRFDQPVIRVEPDDDLTLAPLPDLPAEPELDLAPVPPPPILVRLLGPVSVRSADGREAAFEKSKAKELIAWLATHRERSTRSGARTALWELDVRDATFANVVSEARRTLARLVEPPPGEEWIGRTLNESLPLHGLVRTDADLVRAALDAARLQPPEQAIATLRPAADLVVGMPFDGTGYLWPEAEGIASRLVLLATSVTAELAAHCLSMGDIDGVFDATGRGLQVLPGHEELIGLRMRAHAGAGDQAGVRHEWAQYERVVNADPWSDGEPSPTLVELRRDLLAR